MSHRRIHSFVRRYKFLRKLQRCGITSFQNFLKLLPSESFTSNEPFQRWHEAQCCIPFLHDHRRRRRDLVWYLQSIYNECLPFGSLSSFLVLNLSCSFLPSQQTIAREAVQEATS